MTASFYANEDYTNSFGIEMVAKLDQSHITSCTVTNAKENIQFIGNKCTKVNYTIAFPVNDWCELFLRKPLTYNGYDVYYIRQLPCPLGFVKIDGIWHCYPSFKQFGFSDCNINTQRVFHPRRGWILLNAHIQENDSYSCYISRLCPYDYCKPYPFYLILIHSVSSRDLAFCVENVNKASVPYLVLTTVNAVQMFTCYLSYLLL